MAVTMVQSTACAWTDQLTFMSKLMVPGLTIFAQQMHVIGLAALLECHTPIP